MPLQVDLDAARRLGASLVLVGQRLKKAGFNERSVCGWYGAPLVSDVRYLTPQPGKLRKGLGAWIALWVAGEPVERRSLGSDIVGGPELAALVSIGLLELEGDLVRPRASLVPVRNTLILADRLDDRSPSAVGSPDLSAWNLIASLPPRVTTLLDVGCGAGTAALVAAQAGAQVIGTDLDGQALAFAAVNALLNDLPVVFLEGDLYAGVHEQFACVCFNAPLVRAPLVTEDAPLYLRSPRGESLAVDFLVGAHERTAPGGEALCHVQLTPTVAAAAQRSGFSQCLELHFADASDGTPHGLVSLRDGATRYHGRVRLPLGAALPHLHRELLDRLHATAEVLASGDAALRSSVMRPPPWLQLTRTAIHDGGAFRQRELRLGSARLEPDDLALLESCDGRPLGEVAPSDEGMWRARELAEKGLLVV